MLSFLFFASCFRVYQIKQLNSTEKRFNFRITQSTPFLKLRTTTCCLGGEVREMSTEKVVKEFAEFSYYLEKIFVFKGRNESLPRDESSSPTPEKTKSTQTGSEKRLTVLCVSRTRATDERHSHNTFSRAESERREKNDDERGKTQERKNFLLELTWKGMLSMKKY